MYNDLRNLARRDGRDPAEYFTLYGLEGFLVRLAASDLASDFVLKGGVLMAAFAARRPTRDIDLATAGFPNNVTEVEERIRAVIARPADDGLSFESGSLTSEAIRDHAEYTGVRVKVLARLAQARIPLHVDVNFGDPIWPAPTDATIPLLLGGTLRLRGYPDHMVLAEKIVTALDRGEQNTRWRDFVDVVALTSSRYIDYSEQRAAIDVVAHHRQVVLQSLHPLSVTMPELAQRKWEIWRRKQRLHSTTPERFAELFARYLGFAEPVLDRSADGAHWNPSRQVWELDR
ncbi:hypothetical protein HNR09_000431 [Nesterenkonia xinjiangensis]|uniref:Nucleotidyl transferase AbiEii toxin, Type IV TA system n=1 Tax=Nesterenkonia xinjiangensis TaxID=225327 RepID=A0A7Z0GJA3_9MICC|nr:hypothetical protein [Nesterenkonia xinjiangensis]